MLLILYQSLRFCYCHLYVSVVFSRYHQRAFGNSLTSSSQIFDVREVITRSVPLRQSQFLGEKKSPPREVIGTITNIRRNLMNFCNTNPLQLNKSTSSVNFESQFLSHLQVTLIYSSQYKPISHMIITNILLDLTVNSYFKNINLVVLN